MKKILFILVTLILLACGGSKKVIQNTEDTIQKEEKDIVKAPLKEEKKIEIEEVSEEVSEEVDNKEKLYEIKTPIEVQKTEETTPTKTELVPEIIPEAEKPITPPKTIDHQSWNNLLQKNVSNNGIVNYKGFKKNRTALKAYIAILSENMPTTSWSKNDKLAYWMNAYNAFTIKLIIDNYPVKSIKDIKNPWDARLFKLGKKWYNLNEIEHQILRKIKDPRIHFGINCASFSCPPISNKAFTAKNVDQELKKLTIAFVNDPKRNTITANKVQLSKIFTWFAKDFKTQGTLIDFLNKYSKISINSNAKKSYLNYDWTLNE